MRLAFALRELEQRQRALDVDLVRGDRRELGPGGQQRGEVEDEIDLELREHALEQVGVGDRAGELAAHERRRLASSGARSMVTIGRAGAGQPRDQAVADLAAGPGHQRDGRPH